MDQINTVNLPSAGGIDFNQGDVRHIGPTSALDWESISFATRCLAKRDAILRDALNTVIASWNNFEPPVYLPIVKTRIRVGGTEQVSNYRIPDGYQARVSNAIVASVPANSVRLDVLYSTNTFGASSGTTIATTATELTSPTAFFNGPGELIVVLTNIGTSDADVVGSILVGVRSLVVERSQLSAITISNTTQVVVGPKGDQGPRGLQGDQGPRGYQGIQGPQGSIGPAGIQGPQGSIGPAGSGITATTAAVSGTLIAWDDFSSTSSPYLDYQSGGTIGGTYYLPMQQTKVAGDTTSLDMLMWTYHHIFSGSVLVRLPTQAYGADIDWSVSQTVCIAVASTVGGDVTTQAVVSQYDNNTWQIDVDAPTEQLVAVTIVGQIAVI